MLILILMISLILSLSSSLIFRVKPRLAYSKRTADQALPQS